MAFKGYLEQVGSYQIPLDYIQADTYKVTRNTQDLDSYNDANGLLHRNALSLVCDKTEFITPYIWNDDLDKLLSNIESQYVSRIERKAAVDVFVPEFNTYTTQYMYFSNPEIQIYRIDSKRNKILYSPVRICFIGYGVTE